MYDIEFGGEIMMDDALLIQTVQQLAEKHNVKVEIDFDTYHVMFDGELQDELALALELEEIFGDYEC